MQTNNIDKNIAERLKNRSIRPSASAWERLSNQLEEQKATKKKRKFIYLKYAAAIALLISIGFAITKNTNPDVSPQEILVETIIDTISILPKEINTIQKEEIIERGIAEAEVEKSKIKKVNKVEATQPVEVKERVIVDINPKNAETLITDSNQKNEKKTVPETIPIIKRDTNIHIRVSADDLLYAVTHTPEEVKVYYAQNKINRNDLLKQVEDELRISKLKINPETILAEVENEIYEADDYKENFMKKFTTKLSEVIVAISDRNK